MADVFVSYKREERAKVETLVAALKKLGLDVWYDYEIVAGDQFERVISQELNAAKAVIVCWSKAAVESEWVQAEADKARAAEKFASVSLEPCELPMPYNVLHWADLSTWSGALPHDGVRQLVGKLATLVSPKLKQKYAELCEAEARSIEATLNAQGADEGDGEEEDTTPAPSAQYVFGVVKNGVQHAGSVELSASITQALLEEEILRDERTKWVVAAGEGVAIDTPPHVRVTRSLAEALGGANDGECVVVLPGTYSGRFDITKNIRVFGFGAKERPVITGDDPNAGEVLKLSAAARIENLVVESRQRGHALLVASNCRPTIIRCLISRFQLVPHDWASAHAATGSRPTFLATTITGNACPAMQFAGAARGEVLACDVQARDYSAVVLTGGAKPHYDRCSVVAYDGHAVWSSSTAAGVFENCYLRSTQSSVVLNEDQSFSKFIANRVSARKAGLIEVKDFARGRFERNRLEPCPELRAAEITQAQRRPSIFGGRRPAPRAPAPIQVSSQHRARFAENRLPDGSVAQPLQISA